MPRSAELLLLLPLLVLLLVRWRTGAMPTGRLLLAALLSMIALGGALAWFGTERGVSGSYRPARLQDGRVLPGGP